MSFSNVLHVFSDNLIINHKRVINGIELLAIPQGINWLHSNEPIDSCPTFMAVDQPMMIVFIQGCHHVYITLSTYMKYSIISLRQFIDLSMPRCTRKPHLNEIELLTAAKVSSLMKADPCVAESHMMMCNTSEDWLMNGIIAAQKIYCHELIGTDTLTIPTWTNIPKDDIIQETTVPTKSSDTSTASKDQSPTHEQPDPKLKDLDQQLAEAITQRDYNKRFIARLMQFISHPPDSELKDEITGLIKTIYRKMPAHDDPSLTDYLDNLYELKK